MTGLNVEQDVIIQIACFVTDYDLNVLDEDGYQVTIHQDERTMNKMNEWSTKTHGNSGLTAAVLASTVTSEQAAEKLLAYIKKLVPTAEQAVLAGNSVHADKAFLRKAPYDKVMQYLHYRILDISVIKEAVRRWASDDVLEKTPRKTGVHQAKEDILESIEEAKYYRKMLFS